MGFVPWSLLDPVDGGGSSSCSLTCFLFFASVRSTPTTVSLKGSCFLALHDASLEAIAHGISQVPQLFGLISIGIRLLAFSGFPATEVEPEE